LLCYIFFLRLIPSFGNPPPERLSFCLKFFFTRRYGIFWLFIFSVHFFFCLALLRLFIATLSCFSNALTFVALHMRVFAPALPSSPFVLILAAWVVSCCISILNLPPSLLKPFFATFFLATPDFRFSSGCFIDYFLRISISTFDASFARFYHCILSCAG